MDCKGPHCLAEFGFVKFTSTGCASNRFLDHLIKKYGDVFHNEAHYRECKPSWWYKKIPHQSSCFVPYVIRGAIEKDLEHLESVGVIKKVNYSNWAAPIVPLPKAVRICGDYKITVNIQSQKQICLPPLLV